MIFNSAHIAKASKWLSDEKLAYEFTNFPMLNILEGRNADGINREKITKPNKIKQNNCLQQEMSWTLADL